MDRAYKKSALSGTLRPEGEGHPWGVATVAGYLPSSRIRGGKGGKKLEEVALWMAKTAFYSWRTGARERGRFLSPFICSLR